MKKILPFLFVITLISPFCTFAQTCVTPTGGVINGSSSGCTDRVATYTVSGVANATGYTWVVTGATASKVSDTEYTLLFGNTASVVIQVTPTNGSCTGTAITKSITVTAAPAKPTITQTGTTLSASTATSYQWYIGSMAINGATSQTYSPTQSGSYSVSSSNTNGCSTFSDPFNYTFTAIKEDARFKNFSFYPNPVVTNVHTNFNQTYGLMFFDTAGKMVLVSKNLTGEQEIDLSSLKKGIYMMKITSGDKIAVRKLLLQ